MGQLLIKLVREALVRDVEKAEDEIQQTENAIAEWRGRGIENMPETLNSCLQMLGQQLLVRSLVLEEFDSEFGCGEIAPPPKRMMM